MKEIILREDQNGSRIEFNLLEDWDSFEDIAIVLQNYFYAKVTKRIDGPESKFLILNIDSSEFTLINNPYGNSLKASTKDARHILNQIYNNWNRYAKL